jgi:MFS family permease
MNNTHTRRLTWLLFFGQSLNAAAYIAGTTIGAIVGTALSGQPALAGLPPAAFGLGTALGAYPAARLMERIGRRRGLMLGYLAGVAGALTAGVAVLAGHFGMFLLGFAGMGVARGFIDLGRYAAAEMNPAAERARAISLVVVGGTLGALVGPALIAPMGDWANSLGATALAGPWFASAALYAVGLLLIGLFLRPDPSELARQFTAATAATGNMAANAAAQMTRPARVILAQPATQLALLAMVAAQLVMSTVMSIAGLHMTNHGHALGDVSIVTMAHTLGMFGLSMVSGRLADNFGRVRTIVAGVIILVLGCAVAPLSLETSMIALSMFLLGLGWNFCYVAGAALLTDSLSIGERGRVQGGSDLTMGLIGSFGSLQSGLLFAWTGFTNLSVIGLVIGLLPLPLAIWHLARRASQPSLVPS